MRKYILLCCCLLLFPCVVHADNYVVSGGSVEEEYDVDSRTEVDVRDGDSNSTSNSDTDSSSSGGTRVELSPEESRVANAKIDIWKYLKNNIMTNIRQGYAGSTSQDFTFIGTGKLSDGQNSALQRKLLEFNDALRGNGSFPQTYNSNDLPADYSRKPHASLNSSEKNEFTEKISSDNNYNDSPMVSSGNSSIGGSSSQLPAGYGIPSYSDGKIDLHNRYPNGSPIGAEYKTGYSFDNFAPDIIKDGVSDFENWSNRYKTLDNYYQDVYGSSDGSGLSAGRNTALADYDDVAYVTSYHITDKDNSYYTISDYTNYTKWQLKDSDGNVVQSGEGTKRIADLRFDRAGTYQFIVKQKVKITKGTAIRYAERKYLILIPTNTLLYFNETELGPVILNQTTQEKYITISTKTFKVKDLNNESMNSNIERVE